jgi:hypothetical protein
MEKSQMDCWESDWEGDEQLNATTNGRRDLRANWIERVKKT